MIAAEFRPADYGPVVARLLEPRRLAELGPGSPHVEAYEALKQLTNASVFGGRLVSDLSMASACLAGLWLYHDYLDESHRISQEIHTATGSFWHAIMHRREGDYSNSKYWFRQVGRHPVYPRLQRAAAQLSTEAKPDLTSGLFAGHDEWDAEAFIDLCQKAHLSGSSLATLCRWIQLREWEILFDYCFRVATEPRPA
jgi:hypothetical protein